MGLFSRKDADAYAKAHDEVWNAKDDAEFERRRAETIKLGEKLPKDVRKAIQAGRDY